MTEMIALLKYIAVACVGLLVLVLVIHFSKTILKKKSIKTVWSSKADGIMWGLTTGNETAKMLISNFEGNSKQNTSGCKQSCDMAILFFCHQ